MAKKRENSILDLEKYMNTEVIVKFSGGREVSGKLSGYDTLLNLVLEDAIEERPVGEPRVLGRVVCRGGSVLLISPSLLFTSIPNPFSLPSS